MATPLNHLDPDKKSDEDLLAEARKNREDHKDVAFTAELLTTLRSLKLRWWTPEQLRADFPAAMRMAALSQRPDIRQMIATTLAGIPIKTSRKMAPGFQAMLLDQVVDNDDVSADRFEDEFSPDDLAVYMDAASYWHRFRDNMPWDDRSETHQQLVRELIEAFLKPRKASTGKDIGQILTHWDVLSAIDRKVWQSRIPLDMRAQIDDALLRQEKERQGKAFHAKDILDIATPEVLTKHIPLADLVGIFDAAERAMGFEKDEPVLAEPGAPLIPDAPTVPPPAPNPTQETAVDDQGDQADADAAVSLEPEHVEVLVDDGPPEPKDSRPGARPPELPRVAAHIPEADFQAARDRSAAHEPHASHGSSAISTSVFEVEIALGIDFPMDTDIPTEVVADLKTLTVDKQWIEDEPQLRAAIIAVLPIMDPSGFPADGSWKSRDLPLLRAAFLKTLEASDKTKPIAAALRSVLARKGPPRPLRPPPRPDRP